MATRCLWFYALVSLLPMVQAVAGPFTSTEVVLAVHGGTGYPKNEVSPEKQQALREALTAALKAGYARLQGKEANGLDAVETAIHVLEDSPLFNAGKGAVFTHEGKNELDASIMEGKTKRAGAVAGVTTIKNPISAARAVMEKSLHVMLVGKGAEVFAKEVGLTLVSPKYFWTQHRWDDLQKKIKKEKDAKAQKGAALPDSESHQWGTVGAVARDKDGNLFAGTSTGGMTNKRFGRVGDSPIIGAGTYAENDSCAVSGTGHGEYFIRLAVAHDICSLVKYRGWSVEKAANEVVHQKLKPIDGEGGVIVLDAKGNLATPYFADGLYRGSITADGTVSVYLYEN